MNPVQQKNHKTAMNQLEQGVMAFTEETVTRVNALGADIGQAEASFSKRMGEERTARLKMADEQRHYVDINDAALLRALCAFRDRRFWSRVNWLLTGR